LELVTGEDKGGEGVVVYDDERTTGLNCSFERWEECLGGEIWRMRRFEFTFSGFEVGGEEDGEMNLQSNLRMG
jgi:hypothetical protein